MKILFSGASSFTGYWFVSELVRRGHEVTAVFRQPSSGYSDLRGERIATLPDPCRAVFGAPFGHLPFVDLIASQKSIDLYCHHAASVGDYRAMDFDVVAAISSNTHNLRETLTALRRAGCAKVVVTGTVFEKHEGAGSGGVDSVSPYALSKYLTAELFAYFAKELRIRLGKFVIANPFGPYEEHRYSYYLMHQWLADKPATVKTPHYVRDNIHVSLLAQAYATFCEGLPETPGASHTNPSGYVETQGAFTARYAAEMRSRLQRPCEFSCAMQTDFPEPRVRINTDPVYPAPGWSEAGAWDELATYYLDRVAT